MPRTLPAHGALLRRRAPVLPQITITTPVSPQPPGVPILVSGSYGGSPTSITLVWRQGGQDVGSPLTASTIAGGAWSGTIITPALPGGYTLRATFNGTGPVTDSAPIEIVVETTLLANFVFEGTGTSTDTVALFGHGFEQGTLQPGGLAVLRRTDTQAPLRTQINPLKLWPDGSIRSALLAGELPPLADAATLGVALVADATHPDPGPALDFAAALAGRTAVIAVFNPTDAVTPIWTFNPLAAIGTDRWHQGPLALSTRVATTVPQAACGVTSVRLVVDVIVTRDGFLELDVCFSNDRVHHSGGGIATFGYTITIDGTTVYDQRPGTGAARQLLQYSQWIRRRGRAVGAAMPERSLFRPDFDLLVRAGVQLAYDRSAPVHPLQVDGAVNSVLAEGVVRPTDPYWHWGIARGAGDVGGRPEIGYRTFACAMWLRDGLRNAIVLAQRQFEAAATRGMYFYDWDLGRWLNPVDWPRMSLHSFFSSPVGTDRGTAVGLPSGQRPTHNINDHMTINHTHHGSFNWTVALLSGRRLAYDGLAARSAWAVMDQQEKANGVLGANVPNWHTFTPDHTTGRAWAVRPWAPQVRGWAWDFRDLVDCAAILPDNYEGAHRIFYDRSAEAWVNSIKDVLPTIQAMFPAAVIGTPMIHTDGNHLAAFMYSFIFYGAATAMRTGIGGNNLAEVVRGWATFRANIATDGGFPYRNVLAGTDIYVRGNPQPPLNAQAWADVWAKTSAGGIAEVLPDWSGGGEGDWQRNTLSGLALMRDLDLPLHLRARLADALVLLRSERMNAMGHPHPRIQPNDFFGTFFMSNSVTGPGITWQWNTAPVILPGQSFEVPGDAVQNAVFGVVRFAGSIPRNSASGLTPSVRAWEITSQPAGNPFAISMGGALRLSGSPPAAGTTAITVRCRTYEGGTIAAGDPSGTPHLSAPVTVNITTTAVPAAFQSVTPTSPRQVMDNVTVGTTVFAIASRGNAPITPSIVSGNTALFEFVPVSGNQFAVRTRAALTGQLNSYPLTLRLTNAHGVAEQSVVAQVVAYVDPPVLTAGQTLTFEETLGTGATPSPGTIAYTGGAVTHASITAGNTGDRLTTPILVEAGNVRLRNAAPLRRRELATMTPTVLLQNANPATSSGTVAVDIVQPWVHRTVAPSLTYIGAWSVARRLVNTYTGPLCRVRRSSDNAEQDIGFVPGGGHHVLDETALTAFVGAGNGFVVRIYDQSLETAHLANTTAGTQPQIVASGAVLRIGSSNRAAMLFGSNRRLDYTYPMLPANDAFALLAAVQMHSNVGGFQRLAGLTDGMHFFGTDGGRPVMHFGNGGILHSVAAAANATVILYCRFRNVIGVADRNRVGFSGQAVETLTGGNHALFGTNAQLTLGANTFGNNPWPGRCAELVLASALTIGTEETGLYAAAGSFYGV